MTGEIEFTLSDVWATLIGSEDNRLAEVVIFQMRLPRVLLVIIVGGGLAACGAVMQSVFRNPLVEPGIIGVSTGSALAAVLYIVLFQSFSVSFYNTVGLLAMPFFTFVGALLATLVVYRIASFTGYTNVTFLILAGVAVNAFCMALTGLVLYFADNAALREFTFWSFGSFANASWTHVGISLFFVALPMVFFVPMGKVLNLFALGEQQVNYSGFNAQKIKRNAIILTAITVGGAVAMVGVIGFVGLVVPHIVRLIVGPDCRKLIPLSILLGAVLTLFADLLAKGLLRDTISLFGDVGILEGVELPVGMITSLMGAPFFVYLLLRAKRKGSW